MGVHTPPCQYPEVWNAGAGIKVGHRVQVDRRRTVAHFDNQQHVGEVVTKDPPVLFDRHRVLSHDPTIGVGSVRDEHQRLLGNSPAGAVVGVAEQALHIAGDSAVPLALNHLAYLPVDQFDPVPAEYTGGLSTQERIDRPRPRLFSDSHHTRDCTAIWREAKPNRTSLTTMTITVSVAEAKASLSELLRRAEAGEEILVARNGQPVAKLSAVRPRVGGFLHNDIAVFDADWWLADDELANDFGQL